MLDLKQQVPSLRNVTSKSFSQACSSSCCQSNTQPFSKGFSRASQVQQDCLSILPPAWCVKTSWFNIKSKPQKSAGTRPLISKIPLSGQRSLQGKTHQLWATFGTVKWQALLAAATAFSRLAPRSRGSK